MSTAAAHVEGRRIHVGGTVQGVGFRPWVYRLATDAGVTGCVRNDSSGVVIDAFGEESALTEFIHALEGTPPPAAAVATMSVATIDPEPVSAFVIVESERSGAAIVSIPPDLATCDQCVAEIFDPTDRRYRYPFTNCTNCGPRFTIATDIPYDRAATTMSAFRMCDACRREYEDPHDRRFHAQPNACPECGPRLTLHTHTGARIFVDDALTAAANALRRGLIVAVKGIGGFHLACDATDAGAVRRLRERKRRDEKPFAVMVRTIDEASALADVGTEERRLLESPERPVVLARSRPHAHLAGNVAPRNHFIGLLLPYSPLHHLLLACAERPLVMTSANLSEEPIAFENGEAVRRLGTIADLFLLHDRAIQTRCDDSVATVIAGRGVVLRRSRGAVPREVRVGRFDRPVLACGALLKNTFCLVAGERAWPGPHIGDLENLETFESYKDAIARLERFLQVRPEVIAYDLHPDYLSTRYAQQRPESVKVAVQHHHAHVASVMAEHAIDEPVIGIAYDGTGYGTDGTVWGGELLIADYAGFDRIGTCRPIALAGGDVAIREPWRLALALLVDAFGDVPRQVRALLPTTDDREASVVERLIREGINAPLAHGVGRYFDAFGAFFLNRRRASYEGQIALEWNQVADGSVRRVYPFDIERSPRAREEATRFVPHDAPLWQLDFRPMVRAAVDDFVRGEPVSTISAAFHNTVAEATALLVRHVATTYGHRPIVASGGCFQNARLAEGLRRALEPQFNLLLHARVPPGDGGIALGQAVVANAIARGTTSCA